MSQEQKGPVAVLELLIGELSSLAAQDEGGESTVTISVDRMQEILEQCEVEDWLAVAEACVFLQVPSVEELVLPLLTPAQEAVYNLVVLRASGEGVPIEKINEVIEISRAPETRDFALEGRLRMERGLGYYESGDIEAAREELSWAETRLKSVAKASRMHDLSLLNKANFHLAIGEELMALQVYGDIAREAGHAHETIAISRLNAARIHSRFDHTFDAIRLAWLSHAHSIMAGQVALALESGAVFLALGLENQDDSAEAMHVQVANSGPREPGVDAPEAKVNGEDLNGVFDWCMEHLGDDWSGENRPDLQAFFTIAHDMNRLDSFSNLLSSPEQVEDAILVSAISQSVDDSMKPIWQAKLREMAAQAVSNSLLDEQ